MNTFVFQVIVIIVEQCRLDNAANHTADASEADPPVQRREKRKEQLENDQIYHSLSYSNNEED